MEKRTLDFYYIKNESNGCKCIKLKEILLDGGLIRLCELSDYIGTPNMRELEKDYNIKIIEVFN